MTESPETRPNPSSRTQLREIFISHGFRPRRSLGQSFLVDANIVRKIVAAAELSGVEPVVEIGAGAGAVTQALAERARRLVAVEVDPTLVSILHQTVGARAEIVHADVLSLDWEAMLSTEGRGEWRLVANLPYSITGPAIIRQLDAIEWFDRLVIMVQREVAERLSARHGSRARGLLTVLAEAACEISVVGQVSRNCFLPRPKVDSTILRLDVRRPPLVADDLRETFRRVVKAAFAGRRKTMLNALSQAPPLGLSRGQSSVALAAAGVDPGSRAESLSHTEFIRLAEVVSELAAEGAR